MLEVLERNTKDLSIQLEKRFQAMLASPIGCTSLLKVFNIVQFYLETLGTVLGFSSTLLSNVEG